MSIFQQLEKSLPYVLPVFLGIVGTGLLAITVSWFLNVRGKNVDPERNVRQQMVRLLLTVFALVSMILILSLIEATKDSATVLAGLLGIGFSAAITISSTTFISNAMAGLMLRAVRNFHLGDYLKVGNQSGRVSERGLFHVEIQTEQRDLITFPNLFLVSQPVTVVRSSGTIISTQVSLGYDIPHQRVEAALIQAATTAGLEEPFVYILDLGDYAINYQIAARLSDVKHLLSARSRLRTCVLDSLHADRIEIVSPAYMNQKRLEPETVVITSPEESLPTVENNEHSAPEDQMFDKADTAAQLEKLTSEISTLEKQIEKTTGEALNELKMQLQQRNEERDTIKQALGKGSVEDEDHPS